MNQSIITTLIYETKVSIGSYFHLVTDWFASDEEIKTVIIDQDHVYSKILSLYPNGFVMYLEQDQDGSIYRTNFPLIQAKDADYYTVQWDD